MINHVDKKIISVADLPEDKFYLGITDRFQKILIETIEKKFESIGRFSRENNLKLNFYRWIHRKEIPLSILNKIVAKLNIKVNLDEETVYVKSGKYSPGKNGGNLGTSVPVRFPIILSEELARIISHIFADGCITIDKYGYYTGAYYNKSSQLREEFKQDVLKVFNFSGLKEKKNKEVNYFYLPSSISIILLTIAPTYHSKICSIPNFIKTSDDSIKREFLGAFFDDESFVKFKPPYRYIELTINNEGLLSEIKEMLKEFNIDSTKIINRKMRGFDLFSFYIRGKEHLERFDRLIGFTDANKKSKLDKIIKNPGRNTYAHGETIVKIMEILKVKPRSIDEVSKELNRSYNTTGHFFNKLRNKKLIINKIINGKKVWILNEEE